MKRASQLSILAAALVVTPVFAGVALKVPANSTRLVNESPIGPSAGIVGFPDICKTPGVGSPVPTPYPNVVHTGSSAFKAGTKATKVGGKLEFSPVRVRTQQGVIDALELKASDAQGQVVSLDQSALIELDDGTFCGICIREGRITAVLKLVPAR